MIRKYHNHKLQTNPCLVSKLTDIAVNYGLAIRSLLTILTQFLLFLQIFWAGPMGGAIVAAILYKLVFNPYRGELSVEDASRKLCKN